MKKIMNIAVAVALLCGVPVNSFAQNTEKSSDEYYPNYFITVQGGGQVTLTHYDFLKLVTPQYAISAGHYFSPEFGLRLHVQGYQANGGFQASRFQDLTADRKYGFKAITGDLDFLFNMSNIINPNRASQTWNWILLAGFGANHTWDFDEYKGITSQMPHYHEQINEGTMNHDTFNGRLGTQVEYNVSRNFAISLEADANYKNDMFNLKINDKCDWQIAAFVGLTYKFGMKKKKPAPAPAPIVEPAPAPAPAPVVEKEPAPAPAPVPVVKEEPLNETIFYVIRETDPTSAENTLNKIVDWCEKYPSKGVTIKGYADKGTGNAKVNAVYAKQRAEKVAEALQAKGIDAGRIEVVSYGDTVQPFSDNDSNRCTIVVGE